MDPPSLPLKQSLPVSATKPFSSVDTLILSQTLPTMKYLTVLLPSKLIYLLSLFNKELRRGQGHQENFRQPFSQNRLFIPDMIFNFLGNKYVLKMLRNILSHYLQADYLPSSDFLAFPICNNEMEINPKLAIFVCFLFFPPLEGLNFNKFDTLDTTMVLTQLQNTVISIDYVLPLPWRFKTMHYSNMFLKMREQM